jgi:hypothetical protein
MTPLSNRKTPATKESLHSGRARAGQCFLAYFAMVGLSIAAAATVVTDNAPLLMGGV